MDSSQQPKGRDGVLSALDVFIQALNLAKDTCGVPPAQVAFGAASILLTMIRVCFPLLCKAVPLIHAYLGHDGQRLGLHRTRSGLRWSMPNALPKIEGERIESPQPVRPRSDWRSD